MTSKKKTTAKPKLTNLSRKELALVDAIIGQVALNRASDITATWTEATDNIKHVAKGQAIDPAMRKALGKAVFSLKSISAPKLNTILQLWHAAVNFNQSHNQAKGN